MNISEIIDSITTYEDISQSKLAEKIGTRRQFLWTVKKGIRPCPQYILDKLIEYYPKYFNGLQRDNNTTESSYSNDNLVPITYRPNVELSAGFGCIPISEETETIMIDKKLLVSDKGITINPKYCEIIKVSGDSMLPEYRDGDRVIIDKSVNTFVDGHIFAFRLNEHCYIKRVNVLPDRIKCISLNPEFDAFYINKSDSFTVFGLIHPRIRF